MLENNVEFCIFNRDKGTIGYMLDCLVRNISTLLIVRGIFLYNDFVCFPLLNYSDLN